MDIGLGFIFFLVAKWTDLTTAALWGAAAGLGLVVVQQFVKKVDLLGGLALFGIVMMLISAGYALVFQDEYLIQMRTTVMGMLGAGLYLVDGMFGGKYLGERTARYMFMPDIVPKRLSLAFGGISIIMALLNWGVVKLVSKDVWLYYTTFGDFIIVVILFSLAIKWVVKPGYDAAQAKGESG
ncbi:MAG: septation protein IspZ [Hyphomonadaceae bacterium]